MFRGKSSMRRGAIVAVMVFVSAAVTGCSKDVNGTYVAQGGIMTLELKGGKATMSSTLAPNEKETADYTVNGDKITVKSKDGEMVFTIMKDGSLEGMLGTFRKSAG